MEVFECKFCMRLFQTGTDGEHREIIEDWEKADEGICDECRELGFGTIDPENLINYLKSNEDDIADALGGSIDDVKEAIKDLESKYV